MWEGKEGGSCSDSLVKVSMADEDVVAFLNIFDLEKRRDGRGPLEPSIEEDGEAVGFQPEGCRP